GVVRHYPPVGHGDHCRVTTLFVIDESQYLAWREVRIRGDDVHDCVAGKNDFCVITVDVAGDSVGGVILVNDVERDICDREFAQMRLIKLFAIVIDVQVGVASDNSGVRRESIVRVLVAEPGGWLWKLGPRPGTTLTVRKTVAVAPTARVFVPTRRFLSITPSKFVLMVNPTAVLDVSVKL